MRGRAIIPLVVGLGLGLVALKVFVNVLERAKGATSETVPVVFATANIEPTLEIQEAMIEVRHVPKETAPDICFRDKSEVVGRVTSWPIPKGCPVGGMQLAPKGTPAGMAVRITDGYRAVAVKIDESAGVAGWIKPGSRVDVVALLASPQRSTSKSISKVILQNVEVLAVGQDIGKTGDTAAAITNTVTLLVKPAEVPKLHLAETKGKLRLAMRNQHDAGQGDDDTTTDNDLMASGEAEQPTPPAGTGTLLQTFLGAQAKIGRSQTDKETEPEASEQRPPATMPSVEVWTVDVFRGEQDVDKVKFEGQEGEWRLVANQQARVPRAAAVPALKQPSGVSIVPAKGAPNASTTTN